MGKSNQKIEKCTIILVFGRFTQLTQKFTEGHWWLLKKKKKKKEKISESKTTTLTYFDNLKKKQQDQGSKNWC